MPSAAKVVMVALLVGSLALIVVATTMPWSWYYVGHPHWASVEWIPFTRRVRIDDFILNVLLFVPFGFTALRVFARESDASDGRAGRPRSAVVWVVVAGCLLSIAVELFQVYCHGRIATTADVLSNTLGTWLGTRAIRW
jgi:glycopeptide antibiotics resistance protein